MVLGREEQAKDLGKHKRTCKQECWVSSVITTFIGGFNINLSNKYVVRVSM